MKVWTCILGSLISLIVGQPSTLAAGTSQSITWLAVDDLVSPYSMRDDLAQKRTEIVDVIVQAASDELSKTCRATNMKLKREDKVACFDLNHCPDSVLRVQKSNRSFTLSAFLESRESFVDVGLEFKLMWTWGEGDSTLSICYHPSLHPTVRNLRESLLIDPFFLNRVSSM